MAPLEAKGKQNLGWKYFLNVSRGSDFMLHPKDNYSRDNDNYEEKHKHIEICEVVKWVC